MPTDVKPLVLESRHKQTGALIYTPLPASQRTLRPPTQEELLNKTNSLPTGYAWAVVAQPTAGNYTGTPVVITANKPGFLALQAQNINLTEKSYTMTNTASASASDGQSLQFVVNTNGFISPPLPGKYAMGWPYLTDLWSLNMSLAEINRRTDQSQHGSAVMLVR